MQFNGADGRLMKSIAFTAKNLTCPTWGGGKWNELYITSAKDPNGPILNGESDDGGSIFRYTTNTTGIPKYQFGV